MNILVGYEAIHSHVPAMRSTIRRSGANALWQLVVVHLRDLRNQTNNIDQSIFYREPWHLRP